MKLRLPDKSRLSFTLASALLALLSFSSASAQDGTWLGISGNWTDAGTWSASVANGSGSTANFTGVDITADQTITLSSAQTIGNIVFTDATTSSNNLSITGANPLTLDVASGFPVINVTQSARSLAIGSIIAGADGLQKSGSGTLRLNGSAANSFNGGLSLSGGTLTLDFTNLATPTDLVASSNTVQFNNGALSIVGKDDTTATLQNLGNTTLSSGINTIRIAKGASVTTPSATLNIGALTINPGSATVIAGLTSGISWSNGTTPTADIIKVASITNKTFPVSPGIANAIPANAGLFWRTGDGTGGTARWVNVDSLGQLGPLPAGTITQETSGTTPLIRSLTNADVTLIGNAESYGLTFSAGSTRTMNLGTGGFTFTINGILNINSGKAVISPGTGGTLVIGAERNFVINMDNSGGLDINAPIVNNGAGASSVTIANTRPSGTLGTIVFGGANTFTGATFITNGTLSLTNSAALATTSAITIGRNVGASLIVTATPPTTIPAPITTANSGVNSTISFAVDSDAVGTLNLNGAIGGSGNVVFTTPAGISASAGKAQTINLGAKGTWAGSTTMTTGNLQVATRIVNTSGAADVLPVATVLTLSGGPGIGSGRAVTLDLNGQNQELAGLSNGGIVPEDRNQIVTSTTPATLTINNSADFTFGGATKDTAVPPTGSPGTTTSALISGAISLVKNGAGTFTLGGTLTNSPDPAGNTYTGSTTVNAGVLLVNNSTSTSSAVAVNGGDLGGNGTVGGNVTVAAAGNLSPGVTAGTLNITGNLDISAMASGAGKLKFGLDALAGTNDQIAVAGTMTLGTLALDDLEVTNLGGLEPGTYTLITSTGLTGTATGSPALIAPGFNGQLQTSGNNLQLVVTTASATTPYDTWATAKGLTGIAGSSTDPARTADPDNDGRNNLAEFAFNGNPLSGTDNGMVAGLVQNVSAPAGNEMTLVIAVRNGATFSGSGTPTVQSATVDGVTYTIEGTLGLATIPDSAVSVIVGPLNTAPTGSGLAADLTSADWKYHVFKLDASEGLTNKGFLRAKVTSP